MKLAKVAQLCRDYRDERGRFPSGKLWCREIVLWTAGEEDFLTDGDIRPFLDNFYDEWNHPLRYRYPGKYDPQGFDLYSVGPDGKDDDGEGDDIRNRFDP